MTFLARTLALPLLLLGAAYGWWVDEQRPLSYRDYEYPDWAKLAASLIPVLPVLLVPIGAVPAIAAQKGSLMDRLRAAMAPTEDWGPALALHRAEHFPLQIPEARKPVKTVVPRDTKSSKSSEFNRETAI